MTNSGVVLKSQVKDHWEDETCGVRYGMARDREAYFDEITQARYQLEHYIRPFARFADAAGKTVLEIGVGAGSDFENWCHHARHATGVDLTEAAIALTSERLTLRGIAPDRYSLYVTDAENLPFESAAFDFVYSWGVLHHTPDTARAFSEACRVLRPGGTLRAMIYHVPSWVGLMLAARQVISGRKLRVTMRSAIYDDLESPGTKAYTVGEAAHMLEGAGLGNIQVRPMLSFGDLLTFQFGAKAQGRAYRLLQRFYPRWLVQRLGDRFGLLLLIEATKPEGKHRSFSSK